MGGFTQSRRTCWRMSTLVEYITICRQMITVYVATRPILNECRQGERKRGAVPHRWWWEQQMDLGVNDATGLYK